MRNTIFVFAQYTDGFLLYYCGMDKENDKIRRVCVIGNRSGKGGRDRLSGILRYSAQTPNWILDVILVEMTNACSRLASTLNNTPPDAIILLTTERRILSVVLDAAKQGLNKCLVLTIDVPAFLLQGLRIDLSVQLDNAEIAKSSARLLIQRGHANLAYVGYRQEHEHSDVRETTLAEIARADGLTFSSFEARSRRNAGDEILRLAEWLKTLPVPCGVITYYDYLSRDVIDACRLARLDVPEQIAVIGADNEISLCEAIQPSLSSILPDFEGGAYDAARELDALMDKRRRPKTTLCRTYGVKSVIERNSTIDLRGGGRLITTACEYIRNHANEHINVDQIAAYCRVSRRLLEIRAREILGKSVREHIESIRMNNVRNLLAETRIPLQEIAFRTGYRTQAYLAARFKALFGCSMRDSRNSTKAPTPKAQPDAHAPHLCACGPCQHSCRQTVSARMSSTM